MRLPALLLAALWCTLMLPGCGCAGSHWDPPSPLMAAIQNNDVQTVKQIVDKHAENLDAERLHRRAMWGDLDFVSVTPLSHAVGRPELLRILVQGGAAVDGRRREGPTALGEAVEFGTPDSAATLLDLGANPMLPVFATSTFTIHDEALKSPDPRVREVMQAWDRLKQKPGG